MTQKLKLTQKNIHTTYNKKLAFISSKIILIQINVVTYQFTCGKNKFPCNVASHICKFPILKWWFSCIILVRITNIMSLNYLSESHWITVIWRTFFLTFMFVTAVHFRLCTHSIVLAPLPIITLSPQLNYFWKFWGIILRSLTPNTLIYLVNFSLCSMITEYVVCLSFDVLPHLFNFIRPHCWSIHSFIQDIEHFIGTGNIVVEKRKIDLAHGVLSFRKKYNADYCFLYL